MAVRVSLKRKHSPLCEYLIHWLKYILAFLFFTKELLIIFLLFDVRFYISEFGNFFPESTQALCTLWIINTSPFFSKHQKHQMHHFYIKSFLPDSSGNLENLILMLLSFPWPHSWLLSYHCFLFICGRVPFVFIPPSEHSFKRHVPISTLVGRIWSYLKLSR